VDEVVGQLFSRHIANANPVEVVAYVVAKGVQQVRLAETGVPVDRQWVVRLTRILGHRDRSRMSEAVRAADDKGLKGVLGIESRVALAPRTKSLQISIDISSGIPRLDL